MKDGVVIRYTGEAMRTLIDGTDEYVFIAGRSLEVPRRVSNYAMRRLPGLFVEVNGETPVTPVLRKARTVGEVFASDPELGSVDTPKIAPVPVAPTGPIAAPAEKQQAVKYSWKNKK